MTAHSYPFSKIVFPVCGEIYDQCAYVLEESIELFLPGAKHERFYYEKGQYLKECMPEMIPGHFWWSEGDYVKALISSYATSDNPILVLDADCVVDRHYPSIPPLAEMVSVDVGAPRPFYFTNYRAVVDRVLSYPSWGVVFGCNHLFKYSILKLWHENKQRTQDTIEALGINAESPSMMLLNVIFNRLVSKGRGATIPNWYSYHTSSEGGPNRAKYRRAYLETIKAQKEVM